MLVQRAQRGRRRRRSQCGSGVAGPRRDAERATGTEAARAGRRRDAAVRPRRVSRADAGARARLRTERAVGTSPALVGCRLPVGRQCVPAERIRPAARRFAQCSGKRSGALRFSRSCRSSAARPRIALSSASSTDSSPPATAQAEANPPSQTRCAIGSPSGG